MPRHGDGGKTHARRNENTAAVESNWPTNWNAREEEKTREADASRPIRHPSEPMQARPWPGMPDGTMSPEKLREAGKPFTAHAVECGFLPLEGSGDA